MCIDIVTACLIDLLCKRRVCVPVVISHVDQLHVCLIFSFSTLDMD